ncbi:bifunctional serine/threonine-protein kinase/ABC transporter substrate-binding protein [Streptomyces sp. NPDC054784]
MTEPLLPADPSSVGGHRLLARLGAGGMGVVYLGRTEAGALAAVKVIRSEYADDPGFRARFRREVDLARRVSSPWAVPVTGAEAEADEPWLATAFVPGPSLADAVGRHGPLPARSVRALAGMMAGALEAVHAAGLVHRDVKPGNVLLALDGPRLIDFGIARATDETALTYPDMVVGTPGYLSPEQAEARGPGVTAASDVFSLGCLLAYALLGRPPFGTGTADALLYRTVHDEPDLDDAGFGDDAHGAELRRLLLSCLAKNPAERPTAARIAATLAAGSAPAGAAADWLPEALVRDVAARAAEMLALPDIEPTAAGHAVGAAAEADRTTAGAPVPYAPPGTPDGGEPPTRRRLFAASGAALLVAAAGGGAWAALRDDSSGTGGGARWAIGVQADLSGAGKAVGLAQERGARLAVEEYNARADRPYALALRTSDDGGEAGRAPGAARRLIEDPDVLAVLGPSSDATATEAAAAYDEALLAMLPVSAGNMVLTSKHSRALVLCRPGDAAMAAPIAAHLVRRAAEDGEKGLPGLLQDRTAQTYAWECATITALQLRDAGMPAYPRVVPADSRDLRPVVTDILDAGARSFVYAGYAPGAAKVARELAAAGFEGPRLGPQALLDPRFLELAGDAAEGWLLTASYVDPARTPAAADFRTAFRKRFGAAPPPYAAEAYDAVRLVLASLTEDAKETRKAKGTGGGQRPPKRGALVERLRKARYRGVTKSYAFDAESGSFAGQGGTFLYEVVDGAFRFRGAAPAPTGA